MKPDVGSKGNQKASSKRLKKLEDYSTVLARVPLTAQTNAAPRRRQIVLPGSTKAVELAMTQLILPQVRHVLWELRK